MGHIQYKYTHTKFFPTHFWIFGLIFVLVACSSAEPLGEVSSQTALITQASTKLPPTATFNIVPASPTPTATFTPAGPTATPKIIPTLNVEQSQLAENFIEGSEDCQLPCWHGITPGVSPVSSLPIFLERLGVSYNPKNELESQSGGWSYGFTYYPDYSEVEIQEIVIHWKETIVSTIFIWALPSFDSSFMVSKVTEKLGAPDILELGFTNNAGPRPEYSILMIYEDEQIAFSFEGRTTQTQSGALQMCVYNAVVRAWMYADGEEPYRQYRLFERADYWGDMSRYETTEAEFLEAINTQSADGNCVDVPLATFLNSESP